MAASSCQMLLFLHLAAKARIDVVAYEDDARGVMPEDDEPLRITEITLRPRITVAGDASEERVRKLVHTAHEHCYIANSLNERRCPSSRPSSGASLSAMAAPDLLLKLLTAPGPPGHESEPARVWREAAEGVRRRRRRWTGSARPSRAWAAAPSTRCWRSSGHIDEIALLVSHVSDKGFLHVVQSGGWDPQVLVGPARGGVHARRDRAGRGGTQAAASHRRRGAQEGDAAQGPARGHRREGRRRGALDGLRRRPGAAGRRAARAAERPAGLARARQPPRRVRGARGGAAGEGGRRRRRPGGGRGGGAGGDRRARRARDGLRARAGPRRGGGRDSRHRRSRASTRARSASTGSEAAR